MPVNVSALHLLSFHGVSALSLLCILTACQPASEHSVTLPVDEEGPRDNLCKEQGKCDVFGEDDRYELHDFPEDSMHRKLARSTAMLTLQDQIEVRYDGSVRLSPLVSTLGVKRNLCAGERFEEQPVPGFCSGFLIAPDLLMTAGHCLGQAGESLESVRNFCQEDVWVLFDYGYAQQPTDPVKEIEILPYENSYKCEDVVAMRREHACGHDFAILRLDRPVEGRAPLALRGAGELEVGTELFSIGHPSGLPKKIAINSAVQPSYSPLADFQPDKPILGIPYNSDEFVGNSGGAVFHAETGVVVGLSSCGSAGNDFITNPDDDSCSIVGVCGVNTTCEQFGIAYDMPTLVEQLDVDVLSQLELVVDAE